MDAVLPIIVVCSVGMALCLAYIVFLCVRSLCLRKKKHFEIEEDVLTVKLHKRKRR